MNKRVREVLYGGKPFKPSDRGRDGKKVIVPIITGNVALIPLTRGKVVTVDLEDLARVMEIRWVLAKKSGVYHVRSMRTPLTRRVSLHRFIMNVTDPDIQVDHIDGDGLNCRKSNMRFATAAQNAMNCKMKRPGKQFKGIVRHRDKWKAVIGFNYKRIHIGVFETPEAAARAYDMKARELFGEFARCNFAA